PGRAAPGFPAEVARALLAQHPSWCTPLAGSTTWMIQTSKGSAAKHVRTELYGPLIFDPSCGVGRQARAEHLRSSRVSMAGILERFGRIDRSIAEPPCARRCVRRMARRQGAIPC